MSPPLLGSAVPSGGGGCCAPGLREALVSVKPWKVDTTSLAWSRLTSKLRHRRLKLPGFPQETPSVSPCFPPGPESDLKVRTSPQGGRARASIRHHRCWGISLHLQRSGVGQSYLLASAMFGRPFPRREPAAVVTVSPAMPGQTRPFPCHLVPPSRQ